MKIKNEHLSLKVDLYLEQIKFLKDLIIIQESLKNPKVRPSQKTIENNHSSTSPIPSIEYWKETKDSAVKFAVESLQDLII